MKAVAAILVFTLCSNAMLAQGGLIGDISNLPNLALDTVKNLVSVLANIVQGILGGVRLPNIDVGINVKLSDLGVSVGGVKVGALEDGNVLDLKVDNVTLEVTDLDIEASISLSNLNLPALGNVSVSDRIRIGVKNAEISLTVELSIQGAQPVVSDIVDVRVRVNADIQLQSNIDTDLIKLAIGPVDIAALIELHIGNTIEENKEAIIAQLNQLS